MIGALIALTYLVPSQSMLESLQSYDRKLTRAEERLLTLERHNAQLKEELARIEAETAATRVRKEEAFRRYRRRIRALQRMPAGARLALLGGSRSLADYLDAARVLRWIARHDRELQGTYAVEVDKLADLEKRLADRGDAQRQSINDARGERDELSKGRRARLELLESMSRGEGRERTRREKERARAELGDMVDKMVPGRPAANTFTKNRGRLPWPAAGPVDVRFGQRVERAYGTVTSHNGWDVRATTGSPVHAIAGGSVVFANWLKGYGQLVIVDHGQHYHSLMAHLGRVEVQVGQEVSQGHVIGAVGDSGSMRGTVLYFELRRKGIPVDPSEWLKD